MFLKTIVFKDAEHDSNSLKKVESVICTDLKQEAREHKVDVVSFESKGSDRITLHYTEDACAKKMYFSCIDGIWKIDYKAGRKK